MLSREKILLHFIPKVTGRWASLVEARRQADSSPMEDLLALEQAGATPEELARLAPDYFSATMVRWRGLGNGFSSHASLPRISPALGLWLLGQLKNPMPVIELLQIPLESLQHQLLSEPTPTERERYWDLLGIPEAFRAILGPKGFAWRGPAPIPALPWFPSPLGPDLELENFQGPLPIPVSFCWKGSFHIAACGGIGDLKVRGGTTLIIECCPGLTRVVVEERVSRLEISNCPDLLEVHLPDGSLCVSACPSLQAILMDHAEWHDDGLPSRYPWARGHRPAGDLWVADCPALRQLRFGAGIVEVRRCPGLTSLCKLGSGPLLVEDCEKLTELRTEEGALSVARCHSLGLIRKHGTGPFSLKDCRSLMRIANLFSKDTGCREAFSVEDCPRLAVLESRSTCLRHLGPMTLSKCPSLTGPLPYLRINGSLQIAGCPGLAGVSIVSSGSGKIIGAPPRTARDGE